MHLCGTTLSNGANFISFVKEVKEEVERRWAERKRTPICVVDEVLGGHKDLQKHERDRIREDVISVLIAESSERIKSGRKIGRAKSPDYFGGRHPHSEKEVICVRDRQIPNGDRDRQIPNGDR